MQRERDLAVKRGGSHDFPNHVAASSYRFWFQRGFNGFSAYGIERIGFRLVCFKEKRYETG